MRLLINCTFQLRHTFNKYLLLGLLGLITNSLCIWSSLLQLGVLIPYQSQANYEIVLFQDELDEAETQFVVVMGVIETHYHWRY